VRGLEIKRLSQPWVGTVLPPFLQKALHPKFEISLEGHQTSPRYQQSRHPYRLSPVSARKTYNSLLSPRRSRHHAVLRCCGSRPSCLASARSRCTRCGRSLRGSDRRRRRQCRTRAHVRHRTLVLSARHDLRRSIDLVTSVLFGTEPHVHRHSRPQVQVLFARQQDLYRNRVPVQAKGEEVL
jgi:hypothetical protein